MLLNTENSLSRIKLAVILMLSFGFCAQGGVCSEKVYNAGVESKKILQCTETVPGQPLKYTAAKKPELNCLEVTIHPGQETGWHTHSVAGYAYVISGVLTLDYADGFSKTMKAGDAFAEVVGMAHNGSNKGVVDVVLIAFFTGDEGIPFTKKLEKPVPVLK